MSAQLENKNEVYSVEENDLSEKGDLSSNSFNSFEFQNQLIAIVEELRLKRRLEEENENTIKGLLEEKYGVERKLDEQQRIHQNEKAILEEEIAQLKKIVGDSHCISDDEKARQQSIAQSFQQEIRALKDEARMLHAEKLNQEKKVQDLEGKLKLFNSFRESTVHQINEVQQQTKTLTQQCHDLFKAQDELRKNVHHAGSMVAKYQISNDHLSQVISIVKKKNSSMKQDIISLKTQLLLKNEQTCVKDVISSAQNSESLKGLHNVLAVEEMLKQSLEQNKQILQNLVESSELLNHYVTRYGESEKAKDDAFLLLDECDRKIRSLEHKLESCTKQQKQTEKEYAKEIFMEDQLYAETHSDVDGRTEWRNDFSDVVRNKQSEAVTERKCLKDASAQTDCTGVPSLSDTEKKDVCIGTPTELLNFSVPLIVGEETVCKTHNDHASNSTVKKTVGNPNLQVPTALTGYDYPQKIVTNEDATQIQGSNFLTDNKTSIIHRQSPINQKNHFLAFHDSAVGIKKLTLHEIKSSCSESETVWCSDIENHTDTSEKLVNSQQDAVISSHDRTIITDTPRSLKRHHNETDITPTLCQRKRIFETSDYHFTLAENDASPVSTEEPRNVKEHFVESAEQTNDCGKKRSFSETEILPTSCHERQCDSLLNSPIVKHATATNIISEIDKGIPCKKPKIFSDCSLVHVTEKHGDMYKKYAEPMKNTQDENSCSAVGMDEEKYMSNKLDEVGEETATYGEKLSFDISWHDSAVQSAPSLEKHTDHVVNSPNMSSVDVSEHQVAKRHNFGTREEELCGKKCKRDEPRFFNYNANTYSLPKFTALKQVTVSNKFSEPEKGTSTEKKDIFDENEIIRDHCLVSLHDMKSPEDSVIGQQKAVKRCFIATDTDAAGYGKKHIRDEMGETHCDNINASSPEMPLNVNVSSMATAEPKGTKQYFGEMKRETVQSAPKQACNRTTLVGSKIPMFKFCAATGAFINLNKKSFCEKLDTSAERKVIKVSDCEKQKKGCGKVNGMKDEINAHSYSAVQNEPKRMEKNCVEISEKTEFRDKDHNSDESELMTESNIIKQACNPEKQNANVSAACITDTVVLTERAIESSSGVIRNGQKLVSSETVPVLPNGNTGSDNCLSEVSTSVCSAVKDIISESGEHVLGERKDNLLEAKILQGNDIDKFSKSCKTSVGNQKTTLYTNTSLAIFNKQKSPEKDLCPISLETVIYGKEHISVEKVEGIEDGDTIEPSKNSKKLSHCVGNMSSINCAGNISSNEKITQAELRNANQNFFDPQGNAIDYNSKFTVEKPQAHFFSESGSNSLCKKLVLKYSSMYDKFSKTGKDVSSTHEKKDMLNENEAPHVTDINRLTGNHQKSVYGRQNAMDGRDHSVVLNICEVEGKNLGETIETTGPSDKNFTSEGGEISVLTEDDEIAYSSKEHDNYVRNKVNMKLIVTKKSGDAKDLLVGSGEHAIKFNRKKVSCESEVNEFSSNDKIALKHSSTMDSISENDKWTTQVKNVSKESKVCQFNEADKHNEISEKCINSLTNSWDTSKFTAVSDEETRIRSSICISDAKASHKEYIFNTNEDLQHDSIIEEISSSQKIPSCTTGTINISISSTATIETKITKRHIVETNLESVLYGKNQLTDGTAVNISDLRRPEFSIKESVLKISPRLDLFSGTDHKKSSETKFTYSESEVLQSFEHSNNCGKLAVKERDALNGTGSTILEKSSAVKNNLVENNTEEKALGGELIFGGCEIGTIMYSPQKPKDCKYMLNISSDLKKKEKAHEDS